MVCIETGVVSERGQVTIPSGIRRRKGFRGRMCVAFVGIGDRIDLVPLPENPVEALVGLGSSLPSVKETEAQGERE